MLVQEVNEQLDRAWIKIGVLIQYANIVDSRVHDVPPQSLVHRGGKVNIVLGIIPDEYVDIRIRLPLQMRKASIQRSTRLVKGNDDGDLGAG